MFFVGKREFDDEAEPPDEGLVDVLPEVRREDRDALVLLHPLQQVADLDVRVAVVRVLHFGALAEERIRFVEEQNRLARIRLVEDLAEVLLGLADVLADDLRQIDLIEIELELRRDHLRRHRLAGAGRSREQRVDASAERQLSLEAPVRVYDAAVARLVAQLPELRQLSARQAAVRSPVVMRGWRGARHRAMSRAAITA